MGFGWPGDLGGWGSVLSTEMALTAWEGRAGNGAGNGLIFFLLKGRGCGQIGEKGDGPERAKSFGTTGFLSDTASIASVPDIPF